MLVLWAEQDNRTQTVIATFIGAFIYALAMTVMLYFGFFEEGALASLYVFTVGVAALIVIALLGWVGHLDGLGSVEATMRRTEERAVQTIEMFKKEPFLGGCACRGAAPPGTNVLEADRGGFLQNIDVKALSKRMDDLEGRIFLALRPGEWLARSPADAS